MRHIHGDTTRTTDDPRLWVRILAPTLLFALAVAIRALPYNGIYLGGGVQFFGNDAYYHMRRVAYSLLRFPASLDFDPYINFPEGARAIWTPVFDWCVALALLPLRGRSLPEVQAAAVWIPPLLGGATVVALTLLARRHYGDRLAWVAGTILCISSAHFWFSQLGFLDHHAAVSLASTLLLAATMGWFAGIGEASGRGSFDGAALGVGVAAGACLVIWPGALLHVGLVEVGLLVHLLSRTERREAVAVARSLAWVHATAFVVVAPLSLGNAWVQWTAFSPVVLSNFQPWFFGSGAVFSLACGYAWRRSEALGRDSASRGGSALAIGAILVGASLAIWPELWHGAVEAREWLFKSDSFQSLVAESAPLFYRSDRFTTIVAFQRLSIFFVLVPFALLAGVRFVRRTGHRPTGFLLWWTAALCLVTVMQKRFFNSSSVAVALLFALSLHGCWLALPESIRSRPGRRSVALGALVLVALGLLYPTLESYRSYVRNLALSYSAGKPVALARRSVIFRYEMNEVASWIRRNTPRTSGWMDSGIRPEYGLLAPWSMGHVLEYTGRRPTVTTNFGDDLGAENFLLGQRYYHSGETEAANILELVHAPYVVVQLQPTFLAKPPRPNGMFHALVERDGRSLLTLDGAVLVPALERHRLLWESRDSLGRPDRPWFKVFGFVPGATIIGRAAPGRTVRASLPIRTNQGRTFEWEAQVSADDEGRYTIRVPYSNQPTPEGVTPGPRYALSCGDDRTFVEVGEAWVVEGRRARGPDLCLAAR